MPGDGKIKDMMLKDEPAVSEKAFTCVICPQSCKITVCLGADGEPVRVYDFMCKRGLTYATAEATHPVRTLTATVYAPGCPEPLSVKSAQPLPKELLAAALEELKAVKVLLPVAVGDVVLANVCGTGIDMVATKNLGIGEAR